MKKKIINWGILSSAKIAWEHVIPAILKSKNSKLVAIASRNTLRAKKLAQKFKIDKSYGSYQELYKDQEIDVYITLYPIIYISNQASKHAKTKKISYWKSLYH